jgi:hypothetical protein
MIVRDYPGFHVCLGLLEALHKVLGREAASGVQPGSLAEGRPLSAMQGLRPSLAAGARGLTWPSLIVVGSGGTGTSSALRIAAIASASARTPSIGSDGEPTPAAVIGRGAPRTPGTWSADEPTTRRYRERKENTNLTHLLRRTTADALPGRRSRHLRRIAPSQSRSTRNSRTSGPSICDNVGLSR